MPDVLVEELLHLAVEEDFVVHFLEAVAFALDHHVDLGAAAGALESGLHASAVLGHDAHVGGAIGHHHGKDRKSTRLNSSHQIISYAVFCLKKKNPAVVLLVPNASTSVRE